MLASVVLGLCVLAAFAGLGAVIVRAILGVHDRLALVGLSVPIGGGVLTWFLFLVSWAGIPLTPWSSLVVWLLLLAVAVGLVRSGRPRLDIRRHPQPAKGDQLDAWIRPVAWLAFGGLIGLAGFISLGHAYGSWDAAAGWAAKGYGIAKEGTIFAGEVWGAWGLAYPLNLPIQIGLFQMFGHDMVPLSKALFPIFLASLGLSAYRFWQLQGVSGTLSALGMVFLVSVPLVFLHGTQGYGNVPFTAYFVQGVLWGIIGLRWRDRRTTLMSGLLLGLSSWTWPEGFLYALAAVAGLLAAFWVTGQRRFHLTWWLAPLAVIAAAWLLFGWSGMSSDRLGGGAIKATLEAWRTGAYHLRELYLIPRLLYDRALDLTRWGTLFQVTAVLVVLRLYKVRPKTSPEIFVAFVMTALASFVAIGLFYLQSYTLGSVFMTVLDRSFDRAFFPAATLMVLTAVRMYAGDMPKMANASTEADSGVSAAGDVVAL